MSDEFSVNKTTADATIPDPEELGQRNVEELHDIPLPEKVSKDFGAGGDDANEDVELDDDLPDGDKEDLSHGDEGIDDPQPTKKV